MVAYNTGKPAKYRVALPEALKDDELRDAFSFFPMVYII
jgi:hypothetical protein